MGNCLSEPINFDGEVNLYHFHLHRAVGKGAFGKVRVVEHRMTKKLYALKYIEKSSCIKKSAVGNVLQERRLLEEIDHPYIVNLRYAFQDDENCFYVLDLMLGGDLRFHLDRNELINEQVVRFWTAELASALNYLHKEKIMHRDVKPDNVLLDAAGHAHLTDFNVAIHYSEHRLHTSIAGSTAYMAPEVLARKGYTWHADYWSLGVSMWEMLFHQRPFNGQSSEKLTSSIIKDSLKLPVHAENVCSRDGLKFFHAILERNPRTRFACQSRQAALDQFRSHPWFADLDWDQLLLKQLQPPFVPDLKKANFDVSHELDEFLMLEKPLTHTSRKKNVDLDKLKPEFRQLEEEFGVYDYTSGKRSYYPYNQPNFNNGTESDSVHVVPPLNNTMVESNLVPRSIAPTPMPSYNGHSRGNSAM